jgi:predicted kinase
MSSVELVIFVGVQASCKSTFYRERFFTTHLRVNLDMLRTRHRERELVETCLRVGQPLVIDNTNPTKAERQPYIEVARAASFRVTGYYFQSNVEDCKRRNDQRSEDQRVPLPGLLGTYVKLEIPAREEGFDELFYVRLVDDEFVVEEWRNEI